MNSGSEKQAQKLIFEGEEMQMTPKFYSVFWINGYSIFRNSAPAAVNVEMS